MRRHLTTLPLVGIAIIVILAHLGIASVFGAEPPAPVTLDQQSIDAVASVLERVVDEKAAALHAATQPDMAADALDHLLISAINMAVGFLLAVGFGLLLHRKAVEKGLLPNIDEIRDAVGFLRTAWQKRLNGAATEAMSEPEKDAERQAGLVLLAGALPTSAYIVGVYMVIASLATPHG